MSKRLEEIKKMLFEKKAEKDNTIDLNAYAMGLADMAKESENYAREVAQASLEIASEKAKIKINTPKGGSNTFKVYENKDGVVEIDKESITNPDNIALL